MRIVISDPDAVAKLDAHFAALRDAA